MLIVPHTLALITTYRCTAACDHCCFSCSPRNTACIPPAKIRAYLEQATTIPSIKVVVFTGGECFLLGKELDLLVKAATEQKFITRFVSNGFWATSRQAARRRLEPLARYGLKEANYSTGEQHARFVKPEYVRHAAIAAAELGLTSLIAVDSFGDSEFDFNAFVDDPEFQKHIDAGTVVLKVSPWMRFKGARTVAYTEKYLSQMKQNRSASTGCSTLLKVLGVTPNEDLRVCCGLTMEEIPEMGIGNLREHTIPQLLEAARDDFMKIWICLHGPDAVLNYARKLDPSIRVPGQQAHTCDVCRYIYRNVRVREVVMRQPPGNMKDIVAQYAQGLVLPPTDVDSKLAVEMVRAGSDLKKLKQVHRTTLFHPTAA